MEKVQKRQVAYKVRINDILKGNYVKEEGEWAPNYVTVGDKKVSRVSLMAVVVSKESSENNSRQNLIVDDGSGRIMIRSFDESTNFDNFQIGDFILVIGRPREYLNEKYIVSEILKKIENPVWGEVRKKELEKEGLLQTEYKPESQKADLNEKVIEEQIVDDIYSKMFNLIKESDAGQGADTQEIITKSKMTKAEEIINRLLEQGDVFEIKPGKLKVLE